MSFGKFNSSAGEFTPSWAKKDAASIPSFTPSFTMGQNGMGMQPVNRVPTITAKKPLTLSSLGAGKVGFGGAKSVSLSASKPAAPKPATPAAATASAAVSEEKKEVPAQEEKKEQPASAAPETLIIDSPAELEEAPTTSTKTYSMEEILAQEDPRENINVVFIGHVDAGKSTICGSIMYLTGMVDKRTIEKFEREAKVRNRESWFLAYIMDTNEEERAKGITVEVGRAYFETEHKRFTVLDAPGHKNYVPNMIAGAAQADAGVLVISARKGEFESGFDRSGQTREHVLLAKTLGVKRLIVVVNKMDEETVNWSQERYDSIVSRLSPYLKSVGYNVQRDVTFLPVSGLKGYNLKDRAPEGVCPWYQGPSLFEILDAIEIVGRDANGPLRLPVLDKYNDRGCVITGKVESGRLVLGNNVLLMPNSRHAEVIGITINDKEVISAKPGENVNVKLKGIADTNVFRGDIICHEDLHVHAVREFEGQLVLLELLENRRILTAGYSAVMHIHTAVEEVVITDLIAEQDRKTGEQKKHPRFVKSNSIVIARFTLSRPVCMETFDTMQQLGRFSLRDEGKTIAIGKVTKILN